MMQPPSNGMAPPPPRPPMPPLDLQQQQQQQQQQQPLYPQPPPSQQQQQWMMMPPPPQQPAAMWAQQQQQPPPLTAAAPPPQQQQLYNQAPQATSPGEIRSLWIGDLQYWMDERYLYSCFAQTGELGSVKIIRNKHTGQPESYGFLEFTSHAAAERILTAYNGTLMPNAEQNFRLNWATLGAGESRQDDTPDYTIFVGDLAAEVSDYILQETFRLHYSSVKGAKVVTDRTTGRSKGFGFVRFGDEGEQLRAMTEMNGMLCSTRPMRIGPAATKKPMGDQLYQKGSEGLSYRGPGTDFG